MTNHLKLTNEKLDISLINDLIVHESCGAVSFFCGTTRDNFEDKQVVSLEYEAYDSMALKTMDEICSNIRTKWPDIKNIAIYHRLGVVPVKDASIIIGISSPHRSASLSAVQYAIDELKKMVPIWKLEKYQNSNCESKWKENSECTWSNIDKKHVTLSKINTLSPFNVDQCIVQDDLPISKMLVQINADEIELKRRVNCFVERKREEIDYNNIQDFIEQPPTQQCSTTPTTNSANLDLENNYSCARVNSSVYKNINANSHLKIHRVKNECGPQIKRHYTETLNKLMENKIKQEPLSSTLPSTTSTFSLLSSTSSSSSSSPQKSGIVERLENAENYLNITTSSAIPKNIYTRLKDIENRILHLETVSPEYNHFLPRLSNDESSLFDRKNKKQKKIYTIEELNNYVTELQAKNLK